MSTLYTIKPPQEARVRRCLITGRTDEVLASLRAGSRPSLADKIDGLNPKMETAFRTGRFFFKETQGRIAPQWMTMGETVLGGEWRDLGLPSKPLDEQKRQAVAALESWRKQEIFSGESDISQVEAQGAFDREFQRYGVSLIGPRTAEEIEHTGNLLRLFAPDVLERGLLTNITLNGRVTGLLKYEAISKKLFLGNTDYSWDRYLFTKVFLTGIGYAAFYTLSRLDKDSVKGKIEACDIRSANFAADQTGQGPEVSFVIPSLWDIFAVNYMQFQLMGKEMIGKYTDCRGSLYDFYARHFPIVTASELASV